MIERAPEGNGGLFVQPALLEDHPVHVMQGGVEFVQGQGFLRPLKGLLQIANVGADARAQARLLGRPGGIGGILRKFGRRFRVLALIEERQGL